MIISKLYRVDVFKLYSLPHSEMQADKRPTYSYCRV